MPGTLYLIRCADAGQTATSPRVSGWTNTAISTEAKREALAIGLTLQGAPLTTIYTSDLDRAVSAGQLIGEEAETSDIQPSSNWRGMDPKAEPFPAFSQRVISALQPILAQAGEGGTCALCTHDSTVQLISTWIAGPQQGTEVDPLAFAKAKTNSNLLTLSFDGQRWAIIQSADAGTPDKRPDPPCADTPEKRTQLGNMLRDLIEAGVNARGEAQQWWETCIQNHRNEFTEDSSPGTGQSSMHVPFTQPREDMLTAQVCSVVSKQSPYMLADDASGQGEVEEKKESVLHKFWQRSGFERAIRKASSITVDTNLCWYRVAWERTSKKPFSGLIIDVIPPWNMTIFPPSESGIEGAKLTGHKFYRRVKEIATLQKAGVYYDDQIVQGGDVPRNNISARAIQESGTNPSVAGADNGDLAVECWQVIFKWSESADDAEKTYLATIAQTSGILLSCDYYDYSRPWYFDMSYIIESNEMYYPAVSVGRHLSGLQDAYDKVAALIYNGAQIQAMPPIFGQPVDEKDFRYGYGDFIPSDTAAQNWSPTLNFKGEILLNILAAFERNGDQVARVSANTMGAQQARPTTATEGSIIASGVAVGLEEYIGNFSATLPQAAEFTMELLSAHFADWQQDAALLKVKQSDITSPCNWDVNGNTPGNTPGAKLAALNQVAAFAGQFGPASGFDVYELGAAILQNSPLSGTQNIQIPKEQFQEQQQQAQQAQMQAQQAQQMGQGPQGPPPGPPQGMPPQGPPMGGPPENAPMSPQQIAALMLLAHHVSQQQQPPQEQPPLGIE